MTQLDGTVVLAVTIGKDGKTESIQITKSLRGDYDMSAIDAVRQWTFEPYLLNGSPAEINTVVSVTYAIYK